MCGFAMCKMVGLGKDLGLELRVAINLNAETLVGAVEAAQNNDDVRFFLRLLA